MDLHNMCGICGFTDANDPETDAAVLKSMCDVMAHRGPDGEGQYIADGIALGHRRLSLIDIEGGRQPMLRSAECAQTSSMPGESESGGTFAIVFNGEIYNYRDIAAELRLEGWDFNTSSDTEVLLVGYMAWGKEVLGRLRGMFAFAIWDPVRKELFCARDPFGIKPFYYTEQNGRLIFASEIKSILEHPEYERELNREALEQYLCFQFSVLPETFFKGIFKLLPAHYMVVRQDGIAELSRYWNPIFEADVACAREQAVADIDSAVRESVQYHNVADVEVGSFLSSGIDSSYLAACLANENPSIKTFTVGFDEYGRNKGERDEISWAHELAEKLDVENTSKHISEGDFFKALPMVQWHMDEPLADPSAVALYFVDQLASEQVKAVLSGEGADEFFGGYKIYQAPLAARKVRWLPKSLLRTASKVLGGLGFRGSNYLMRASERAADWYYTNACGAAFTPQERAALLKGGSDAVMPQDVVSPLYEKASGSDDPTQMQYVDILCWMVGDILLKTDKMSMAHSLESRVPFLDREVFSVARKLPLGLRVTDSQTKVALREAAESAIPVDWARKEKLGFPVPLAKWLRAERVHSVVRECFSSPQAGEFFERDELMRLLERHMGGEDVSRRIFIIWMFLMWHRIYFIDKAKPQ